MLMIYSLLKSRKLTVVLFIAFLPLIIIEAETRSLPGYIFIGFAVPLIVNLLLCLLDHLKRIEKWTVYRIGFVLFHASFLVMITGGILTFFTYRIAYIEIAEGNGFTDQPQYYNGWRQKFGEHTGTGIKIFVKKIVLEFWDNGQVKDFYNEIIILDDDKTTDARLKVNGSIKYKSLLINMARFYGLAPYFTVNTREGNKSGHVTIRSDEKSSEFIIPLLGHKAFAYFEDINDTGIKITILGDRGKIFKKSMKVGDIIKLEKGTLELKKIDIWNGLTVVRDSGKGITYIGFIIFLVGLAIYYIRVFIGKEKNG